MSPRTLFLHCLGGLGLWAVAAGFLTHHPKAAWLGFGVFALAAVVAFVFPDKQPIEDSTR